MTRTKLAAVLMVVGAVFATAGPLPAAATAEPDPAVASVIAGSVATRSRSPVPPALTNSKGAACATAAPSPSNTVAKD